MNIDNALYVDRATLQRLLDERRIGIWDLSGPVELRFHPADSDFPNALVGLADNVMPHTVHRCWLKRRRISVMQPMYDVAGTV